MTTTTTTLEMPPCKGKPHNRIPGYVCELRCHLSGHVVIYDRTQMDSDHSYETGAVEGYRWVVTYEPNRSGHLPCALYVASRSLAAARLVMKAVAKATSGATIEGLLNGETRRA